MDKVLKIGILGCGNIAQIRYLPSIQNIPGIQTQGIYDVNPTLLKKLSHQYNTPYFSSVEELLSSDIEAVVICTPPASHKDLSIKSLNAGKHVLIEKPVSLDSNDLLEIKEAAKKSGKVVMALPFNNYPYLKLCKQSLESGLIGKVVSLDGNMSHRGPGHAAWYYDDTKNIWGVTGDLGIYIVSTFIYLQGKIIGAFADMSTLQPQRVGIDNALINVTIKDSCNALFRWSNGVGGTMRCNYNTGSRPGTNAWDIRVYGTEGIIFLNFFSSDIPMVIYSPSKCPKGFQPISYCGLETCYAPEPINTDMCLDIVSSFRDIILEEDFSLLSGNDLESQYWTLRTIEALFQSAKEKRWVSI